MAVTNEQLPTKGQAAPLHGDATKKVMAVLNTAFAMIGLKMLAGLAPKIGAKLGLSRTNQPATPNAAPTIPGARPSAFANGPKGPTH